MIVREKLKSEETNCSVEDGRNVVEEKPIVETSGRESG